MKIAPLKKEVFMKLLSTFLAVIFSMFASLSFADTDQRELGAMLSFNHGSGWQNYQVGTKLIGQTIRDLKVTYDFSVLGGAISTKLPLIISATAGNPQEKASQTSSAGGSRLSPALPKNAIVVGCYVDVITAPTSGGSATIAISTGQAAADLMAATAKASFTGIMACIPTGSAASSIKLTADSQPYIAIATAALTAGKFNVHILYALSD